MLLRQAKQGLTLIEISVLVALMSIFLAMTAVTLTDSIERAGPDGLASTVAAELRAARSEATRSGMMVAVCFPNDGGNVPVSRSFLVRKGEQLGAPHRSRNFDRDFEAGVFVGSWPGSAPATSEIPADWLGSSVGDYVLAFRPDGTMVTNGLPMIDSALPLVVAARLTPQLGAGGFFEAPAISNAHTIWVESSGAVRLATAATPVGAPSGGGAELVFAADVSPPVAGSNSPVLENVTFYPSKNPGLGAVGLGQSYIEIHPEEKAGDDLEYGLATMLFQARDVDGGPLFFEVRSTASSGDEGKFTVFENRGRLSYVDGLWKASVSWRPPQGAPADTEYEFEIVIRDKEGNQVATTSGAGLLPSVVSLQPSRIAVQSTDNKVYVANLEAGDLVQITPSGETDWGPFFSPDGTLLFTFGSSGGASSHLVCQNSDGTSRDIVRVLPTTPSEMRFDPYYMFAGYTHSPRTIRVTYTVDNPDGTTETRTVERDVIALETLHLPSGRSFVVSGQATGNLQWNSAVRFGFSYTEVVTSNSEPYFDVNNVAARLEGFPPGAVPAGTFDPSLQDRVFNLRDPNWWLRYDETSYTLYLEAPGQRYTLRSGLVLPEPPAWSGDGQTVTYLHQNSAGSFDLLVQEVFDGSMARTGSSASAVLSNVPIRSPKLAPEGDQVFFIRNNHLYRIDAQSGATPVHLSVQLSGVSNFAISR